MGYFQRFHEAGFAVHVGDALCFPVAFLHTKHPFQIEINANELFS